MLITTRKLVIFGGFCCCLLKQVALNCSCDLLCLFCLIFDGFDDVSSQIINNALTPFCSICMISGKKNGIKHKNNSIILKFVLFWLRVGILAILRG